MRGHKPLDQVIVTDERLRGEVHLDKKATGALENGCRKITATEVLAPYAGFDDAYLHGHLQRSRKFPEQGTDGYPLDV